MPARSPGRADARELIFVGAADGRVHEALCRLESAGWRVHRTADPEQARRAVRPAAAPRVGLLRLERYDRAAERQIGRLVEGLSGTAWVALVRRDCLTDAGCRALIRRAFYDFHTLPADPGRLVATVGHAHGMVALHHPDGTALRGLLVGEGEAVRRLRAWVAAGAEESCPALVVGPAGTGKARVAYALHLLSERRRRAAFRVVDGQRCGREGTAWSVRALERAFAEAEAGTLLVRRVESLPLDAQRHLVRWLEGAGPGQARLVCTARSSLRPRVQARTFSAALLMRLQGRTAHVPALRERPEDVAPLARHFLALAVRPGLGRPRGFTRRALEAMALHDWPGNVRELEARVALAARRASTELLEAEQLGLPGPPHPVQTLAEARLQAERRVIREALAACRGNVTQAAALLGVSRASLHRLMARHGLG